MKDRINTEVLNTEVLNTEVVREQKRLRKGRKSVSVIANQSTIPKSDSVTKSRMERNLKLHVMSLSKTIF